MTSNRGKNRDDAEIMRFVRITYPPLVTGVQIALAAGGRFADHIRRSFSMEMERKGV